MSAPTDLEARATDAFDRVDCLIMTSVVLLAAGVRLWGFGTTGIDHFDAGGYALSALAFPRGDVPGALYPLQHFLSPPFFFTTSGLLMVALQTTSDKVLVGLSTFLGILTIPLIYLMSRRPFGRPAATAAAILLALSDFHILYSRAALTDVAFLFWFLLAIWLYSEADARESMMLAIAAGLATGFAWNTKYHGWLAGVVAFAALLPHLLEKRPRRFFHGFARLVVAAVVASATYVPWFLYILRQPGGYERLALEHASYLRPLWAPLHVIFHSQSQLYLDGWIGRLAPAIALVVVVLVSNRRSSGLRILKRWLPAMLLGGIILGEVILSALLALAAIGLVLRQGDPRRWVSLSFLVTFTVLTPLYVAFVRLLLPWAAAVFLLAGVAIANIDELLDPERMKTRPAFGRFAWVTLLCALLIAAAVIRPPWESASTFQASDGFAKASVQIAEVIPPGAPAPVWGEPGVAFYLYRLGKDSWHVDLPDDIYERMSPGDTVYLVTGLYGRRVAEWRELTSWTEERARVVTEVGRASVRGVSDVRVLDDFRPARARRDQGKLEDEYELVVYRVVLPSRQE
jgi:hypothetical protein